MLRQHKQMYVAIKYYGLACPMLIVIEQQWTKDMKKSIERYLRDGPDGAQYSRMVDTVLTREKNWVRWKANGCPIISKDAVPSADYKKSKDQTKRLSTNKRMDAVPMGTLNLQFLSDSDREQTLDSLSVLER